MAQIFRKKALRYPLYALVGGVSALLSIIFIISYYFSPKFTDVGYAPKQPVPYSHQLHVNKLGLDCQYCHTNVENSAVANIPATQTCMNCHKQVHAKSPKLLPVRESWATGKPVEWVNVHMLPQYAHFNHSVHVKVGVGCESCHGRVDQMEVVYQDKPHSMSWCLECHYNPEEFLRSPEDVTKMGLDAKRTQAQKDENLIRIKKEGINPPKNCSACHY
jgi:Cytochrome c7 and related cytochrome c